MKKLWILFVAITIVSFKQEAPVDYALISGKIANADAKEMTLFGAVDRSFNHKITIAEDGSFIDTVRVTGSFYLMQAQNITPLYLEAGNNLKINFDANDLKNTLTVTGKGFEASSYLYAKEGEDEKLTMEKEKYLYTMEEADFKKATDSIATARKDLLKAITGINDDFKAKEERNIQYEYLGKLHSYKRDHSYYTKKKNVEPSKDFLSELNTISYNNEEDFKFSRAYNFLVVSHYQKKVSEVIKADETLSKEITMLKLCEAIENQTIKNALIHTASSYPILETENLEDFYAAYKAAGSTNEKNNAKKKKVPTATLR